MGGRCTCGAVGLAQEALIHLPSVDLLDLGPTDCGHQAGDGSP